MLGPFGKLILLQSAENVLPFKTTAFSGIKIGAVTGAAPAVGGCTKAACHKHQLVGCVLVFPPQHIGLDDHNAVMKVILIGNAVALRDGFIVDALEGRLEQLLLNLPCLINDALTEKLPPRIIGTSPYACRILLL